MTTSSSSAPGPAEHLAGHRVRPEGVLLGRRQGAGRGDHRRRVRVHQGPAGAAPRARVVRLEDGEAGLSARTIKRRLAIGVRAVRLSASRAATSGSGATRCRAGWRPDGAGRPRRARGVPLMRARRGRCRGSCPGRGRRAAGCAAHPSRPGHGGGDAARRAAPLRGARPAAGRCHGRRARRLFIAEGKGGHQRIVPVSRAVLRDAWRAISTDERPADRHRPRVRGAARARAGVGR